MNKEEIEAGNKIIAEFLGYKYYKKVLIDDSDCGGLYDWVGIYSKIPIEIDDYPEDGQCYFKDGFPGENWKALTSNINYNSDWNLLIPCINKIYESDLYYKWKETSGQFEKEIFINTKFIEETWRQVLEFINWLNEQGV